MFEKEAEAYATKHENTKYNTLEWWSKRHTFKEGAELGYRLGLEAGRPKWHDLRKDPTDVPKENVTVLLLTEVEPVTARYDNKYEAFFRLGDKLDYCVFIAPMSYIAWCEIPKFEEVEV